MFQAYGAMMNMPRWKESHGKDFVFYDGHPGFAAGDAKNSFYNTHCNEFSNATSIVVEAPQRYQCFYIAKHITLSTYSMDRVILTPYVPNLIDHNDPEATFDRSKLRPVAERPQLIYFSGACTPNDGMYIGKKLRCALLLFLSWQASPNVAWQPLPADHHLVIALLQARMGDQVVPGGCLP